MTDQELIKLKEGDRVVLTHNNSYAKVVKTGIIDTLNGSPMVKLDCEVKTWGCPFFFSREIKNKIMDEKDLVSFGNYLLSKERDETIVSEQNRGKVHQEDIENWKHGSI